VVASDLAVIRELVVDGDHGRLVPPDRPAELARALRVVLEYPERAAVMGAAARRHIEDHFTWDRSRARLRSLYEELAADGRPTGTPSEPHPQG
jgi:glycosyltransferase involved in cell wall biosynthesis